MNFLPPIVALAVGVEPEEPLVVGAAVLVLETALIFEVGVALTATDFELVDTGRVADTEVEAVAEAEEEPLEPPAMTDGPGI